MLEFLRKAIHGDLGAYVQALVVALLLAAMAYVVVFETGCIEPVDPPSTTSLRTQQQPEQRADFQIRLEANGRYAKPGERATRTLTGSENSGISQVSYRWTPPWGATDISYNPAPDDRGPPAVWLDLSPDDEIQIGFNQPGLPPGESSMLATDTALAEWEGHSSATSYTALITNDDSQLAAGLPQITVSGHSPSAIVDLWEIEHWTDIKGMTMTTELCQEWFDLLQSDDVFLAVRAPVSPTTSTEGYQLPVVMDAPVSNTLQLFSYDAFRPVMTVPMELRPERLTFLENALPAEQGERWTALGLVSDTIPCPSSDLAAERWSFLAKGYLDLSHQPANCEQCVLPFYYCYKGQQPPVLPAMLNSVLPEGSKVESHQGWGITCLGPYSAPLVDTGNWELGGASSYWITPTQTLTVYHDIHLSLLSEHMSFTLDYSSTLDVGWHLYDDAAFAPDLSQPITPPIAVDPGQYRYFWMVSDPVPNDTADGAYSLFVTATSTLSPTDSLWVSDLFWIGGWVAPPPPSGYDFRVYLPLVLRSQ